MKKSLMAALAAIFLCSTIAPAVAADEPSAELQALVTKIKDKLNANKKTEADLADELKAFDALIAKHKGEKTEDIARIVYMEATLYKQVLKNDKKGDALLADLKRDFPDSQIVKLFKMQDEAAKITAALVVGAKFPEFAEQDAADKPLTLASYKGKVVLIDFWATWCGPCVGEVPNVVKTYEKYHTNGFEIIGISLDQDKFALASFTAKNKMVWQQFYDGQGFENKLAAKYGVEAIPMTYLLDGDGKIIGKELRGDALEQAVAAALAKKQPAN